MARSIWKGTLGFGLVTIGVELITAEMTEDLDLDLLDRRDHARIGYQKINKSTGEVVPQSEIVRGAEVSDGHYVVLTDEDLKAANPKATQTVDIVAFVSRSDVPLFFYAKPYFVSPLKGSEKAYGLLRDALAATDQIGLAQIVVHTRQYLAAVYPYQDAIVVQLLRYAHEIKSPDDAGVKHVPAKSSASKASEFAMAKQLIDSMESEWKPEQYKDSYRADVLSLIKKRAKSGAKKISPASVVASADEPRVLDLVAALKGSLKKSATPAKKASTRRAPAKKAKKRQSA